MGRNATQLFGVNATDITDFRIKVSDPDNFNSWGDNFNHASYADVGWDWANGTGTTGTIICPDTNQLVPAPNQDELYFNRWINLPQNSTKGVIGVVLNITATSS